MHPKNVGKVLGDELDSLRQHIQNTINAKALARDCGFRRRCPRKLSMTDLLLALAGLAAESFLTLPRAASVIALAANLSDSKQCRVEGVIFDILKQSLLFLSLQLGIIRRTVDHNFWELFLMIFR